MSTSSTTDKWARWLLERRHGGDMERHRQMMETLIPVRDKVLENAALAGDETLLDVGCGDGLIAFGALDKLPEGRVIFADISQDLLDHSQTMAEQMGVANRCQFVRSDATDLSMIEPGSVDVVTTRSVLIYIKNKRAAFEAFYRVLKPGGIVTMFEPINRFAYPGPKHTFRGYDATPVLELTQRIDAVYRAIQPDDDPMLDFDERDLIDLAERAGFSEVHLELRAEIAAGSQWRLTDWDAFLNVAPNPRVPTLAEAMEQALSPEEAATFTAHFRPLVEAGDGKLRFAVAYMWALK